MNVINPLVLGIVTKLYDDIIDMNINVSSLTIEILKTLIILFFALISYNDFYFSIACLIIALLNSGFDNPFWKSLSVVCAIMTLINFSSAGENIIYKIFLTILAVVGILFVAYLEEKKFPEEVSPKKIVFRIILIIIFGIIAFTSFMDYVPIPEFGKEPLLKAVLILFSNLIASVITMSYFQFNS